MTNYTITGQGNKWYVVYTGKDMGLVKSEHTSRAEAEEAMGIRPPAAKPMQTGCYRLTRGISSQGIAIFTAEYITHAGEVRYMMHSAVIDPCVKLINKLTKAA
jgi:hypothetical protein